MIFCQQIDLVTHLPVDLGSAFFKLKLSVSLKEHVGHE